MKASRLLSAACVLLVFAFGSLATSACTTDGSATNTRGSGSSGGY